MEKARVLVGGVVVPELSAFFFTSVAASAAKTPAARTASSTRTRRPPAAAPHPTMPWRRMRKALLSAVSTTASFWRSSRPVSGSRRPRLSAIAPPLRAAKRKMLALIRHCCRRSDDKFEDFQIIHQLICFIGGDTRYQINNIVPIQNVQYQFSEVVLIFIRRPTTIDD
jgi:hypothetical protein